MSIALTNLDRVLFPATGFTKGDLVEHYRRVAPAMLPHLAGRPVTLGRWPGGVARPGFAQTECRGRPPAMRVRELALRSGPTRRYCLIDDADGLLWAANQAAIELHVFPGAGDRDDDARAVLLDLDPEPQATPAQVAQAALALREALAARGLDAVVKTSGAYGLHVVAPLPQARRYEETRALARELAGEAAGAAVALDWRRNHPRQTLVAPYSLRAMDVPSASTPVTWEEVQRGELLHGPADLPGRLERHGDLFAAAAPQPRERA